MSLSETARKMIIMIGIIAIIIISIGAFLHISFFNGSGAIPPFAFGVIAGCGLNVLKVLMLERVVQKAVGYEEKKDASNYVRFTYMGRLLLTAGLLILAATTPYLDLLGTALGIFSMQVAVLSMKFFFK